MSSWDLLKFLFDCLFLPLFCWEVEALCSTIKTQRLSCQPEQNLYQKQPHRSPVPFVLGQCLGEPWRKWERTCHLLDPACYSHMSYQGFMMPHWNSIIVAARYQCHTGICTVEPNIAGSGQIPGVEATCYDCCRAMCGFQIDWRSRNEHVSDWWSAAPLFSVLLRGKLVGASICQSINPNG